MALEVGQKLWFVPSARWAGAEREVVVKKVGRKWAQCDEWRIDVDTLRRDGKGYSSAGRCWISREAWMAEKERQEAWSELRVYFNDLRLPNHVSLDDIKNITARLEGPK